MKKRFKFSIKNQNQNQDQDSKEENKEIKEINSTPLVRDPRTGIIPSRIREYEKQTKKENQYLRKELKNIQDRINEGAKKSKRRDVINKGYFDPVEEIASLASEKEGNIPISQRIKCCQILLDYLEPKKRRIEHIDKDFDKIEVQITTINPKEIRELGISLDQIHRGMDRKDEDEF